MEKEKKNNNNSSSNSLVFGDGRKQKFILYNPIQFF